MLYLVREISAAMAIVLDHTIVPSKDKKESAKFYARIFDFEDLGEEPGALIHPVRVNDSTVLFLENSSDPDAPWAQGIHHLAFHFDSEKYIFDECEAKARTTSLCSVV